MRPWRTRNPNGGLPMDYFLVESYFVAWLTGYASVRQLFLRIKPPDQERPATDTILLSFHEKAPPSPNFKQGSPFQVFLPRSEFDDLYRILQTESPCTSSSNGCGATT